MSACWACSESTNEEQLKFKEPNDIKWNLQDIKGQQKYYTDRNTVNRQILIPDTNVPRSYREKS
jgi:hypothetical protein